MTRKTCGCSTPTCGCCKGVTASTPLNTANRPGLTALAYRAGTHGAFLESMKNRLSSTVFDAVGPDGQTIQTYQPLAGLTTRSSSDPAIALLDGWATVGDVLTFYQERIANEGYLRTATERRSVLELSRLIGYSLRPGVASTVYLAYTLEDSQKDPVVIPPGAQSQSIPGPGELPQTFETSDPLLSRTEWNNLQVRLTQPQKITYLTVLTIKAVYFSGTSTGLKAGDVVLFRFVNGTQTAFAARYVATADPDYPNNRTTVHLKPIPPAVLVALAPTLEAIQAWQPLVKNENDEPFRAMMAASRIIENVYLGVYLAPLTWADRIAHYGEIGNPTPTAQVLAKMKDDIDKAVTALKNQPPSIDTTELSDIVSHLIKPPVPQAASAAHLTRNFAASFQSTADLLPQLTARFAPRVANTLYTAWGHAVVNGTLPSLRAVYAMRVSAPLFGAGVPKITTHDGKTLHIDEWPTDSLEGTNTLFLDQAHEGILTDSYAIVQRLRDTDIGQERRVFPVAEAQTIQRTAYNITGKTTQLTFENPWQDYPYNLGDLRGVLVIAQSEELQLIEEPIATKVFGKSITLDKLYDGLTSGRWVILSGERADIPSVSKVPVSELLMVASLTQDFDPTLPGDTVHTTLHFATTTAYQYKRDTLKIYGNVAKATHGETRPEALGSGDASQALATFTLKQPPLTFVPAPTPAGAASTLHVYVNDVEWHEADTLAVAGPKDRLFVTRTGDDGKTRVTFGNGVRGSRLPTGVENIQSIYRSGIGEAGNVRAQQISMLKTRPLGVKDVINPLGASGGAEAEDRDLARENAPLAVMSLERLVSISDYADFTRTFAGIGKATARRLSDGRRELAHITIAGANDIPIDVDSDLYRNLVIALRQFGDPALPVQVDLRELQALLLSAKVRLAPDYLWEPVSTAIRARLLDTFGFQKRSLGQPALLCEAIAAIQNVPGVAWVDVDAFGAIPEKKADPDGARRLLTQSEMAFEASKAITQGIDTSYQKSIGAAGPASRVNANLADFENGALRPAQLAIFTPAVPDTIILNQIL